MPPGLSPTGFEKRTTEDILEQLATDHRSNISTALDVSSSSPVGQLDGANTKLFTELWDLAQAVYTAMDPDKNGGEAQDGICAITGTIRGAATHSQQKSATVGLNVGTMLTVGSLVAVLSNPSARFRFRGVEPAVVGDPVVEANFTAPSTSTFAMRFEAVDMGPIAAPAGTLTVIVTPISGWTSVTNPTDAIPGTNIEADSALRTRREEELAALGSTPLDAIRSEFIQLLTSEGNPGTVKAFENELDTVDADGRPGHSIEVLIDDDGLIANDTIAQQLWESRAAGIQTFGATNGTARDATGITKTMHFNRPSDLNIYFAITVLTDPSFFPIDGVAKLQAAIVAKGLAGADGVKREPGEDVIQTTFFTPCYSVPGVIDVTVLHLGTAPAPVLSANLVVGVRQMARFDTSRVTITVT